MSNTLEPLEGPYNEDVARILSHYPSQGGYLLSLFRTFANSLRFLQKGVPNLLDEESPLDLRTREIVILRTTASRNCVYEWSVHVAIFARAAGLVDDQVRATRETGEASGWTERETRLIAAIDQLCEGATLDDQALTDFQSDWSREEQLEILALVGAYTTISLVANVARLQPEVFAEHVVPNAD